MRRGEGLVAALAAAARAAGGDPGSPCAVLADRPESTVVRCGGAVAKAHAPGTAPAELRARVAVRVEGVLLPALPAPGGGWVRQVQGRLVTCWPSGEPVDPEAPDAAPWRQGARLLAGLHAAPVPPGLPPAGTARRVATTVRRLALAARGGGVPAGHAAPVLAAARTLPSTGEVAPARRAVVHGDWHLGQLVRVHPGGWRLIDVDDLGVGDPAWDLARPAAWFAAGVLEPAVWQGFLDAYRSAGGPVGGGPWPGELDLPARAATVYQAARAVLRAGREGRPLDEVEVALTGACARIAAILRPHW